jgi:predicted MFS family arabinose efflux permease
MVMLFLIYVFFALGAVLGAIWKWRMAYLFALTTAVTIMGFFYVAEFPSRKDMSNDVSAILWFLLNWGLGLGIVITAGASGAFLGLLLTRKVGKRRVMPPPLPCSKV